VHNKEIIVLHIVRLSVDIGKLYVYSSIPQLYTTAVYYDIMLLVLHDILIKYIIYYSLDTMH